MIEEQSKIFDKTQNCEIGQTWKYHLYPVIKNACMLADKYGADKDVVELAALFHDYADLLDMNNRKNHHIFLHLKLHAFHATAINTASIVLFFIITEDNRKRNSQNYNPFSYIFQVFFHIFPDYSS